MEFWRRSQLKNHGKQQQCTQYGSGFAGWKGGCYIQLFFVQWANAYSRSGVVSASLAVSMMAVSTMAKAQLTDRSVMGRLCAGSDGGLSTLLVIIIVGLVLQPPLMTFTETL